MMSHSICLPVFFFHDSGVPLKDEQMLQSFLGQSRLKAFEKLFPLFQGTEYCHSGSPLVWHLGFSAFAPKTSRKRQFLEISFPRLLLMAVHDCCNLLGPSLSFWVRDQLFSNKTGKMFMNQLNLTISKAIKTKLLFTISIQYQADQH